MNYLAVEGLSKGYADKVLFENINLYINKGQRIALVAQNGTGKTSLLKIIAGLDGPDSGVVRFHPGIRVGYLEQDPELDPLKTVTEEVFDSQNPVIRAISEYEESLRHPEDAARMDKAVAQMDKMDAWVYENRVKQILSRLKVDDFDREIRYLSGGQKKRVALAKLLIDVPDLLILDEPTNHLDLAMIEWLEELLSMQKLSILMVTHDRYFLERVCDEIAEMEDGNIYRYKGNYSYYLEHKESRMDATRKNVDKAKALMRTELEWVRRMPKARGTKSKARLDSFEELKKKARQKVEDKPIEFMIKETRLGSKILELHHLGKSYDDLLLFEEFNYKFKKGEKVGLVGNNGSGKTTFLKLITEQEKPSKGQVVIGSTVQFGYYTQDGLPPETEDKTVIEVIRDIAEYLPMENGMKISASQLLERFMFTREAQYKKVLTLSGGEKRRLHLLTILMQNPNFLILDEPTNDLDILTLNVLEEFLLEFSGCLLVVTHDRYFMDKLVDHLFVLEGNGKIRDYPGNYTQYRDSEIWKEDEKPATEDAASEVAPVKTPDKKEKTKLSYKEKLEFEGLEDKIAELEARKAELELRLSGAEEDHEKIMANAEELSSVVKELEEKTDRWLELSEYV